MTIDEALKWQRLWWFLSLDCVQPFLPDMWIDRLGGAGSSFMRDMLDLKRDLPTFESDPRAKVFSHLERLRTFDDGDHYRILVAWQRIRFMAGTPGGVEEAMWELIIRQLTFRGEDLGLDENTVRVLRDFQTTLRERSAVLRERLSLLGRNVSAWDKKAIRLERQTVESVSHILSGICMRNLFIEVWRDRCTSRGIAFLDEIFKFGLIIIAEDSPVDLIFTRETLPYPSSWEIGLEEFLARVPARRHAV